MAITAALDTVLPINDTTNSTQIARGTLTFSGNYPSGGDILNLALYGVQSNYPPVRVFVYEQPIAGSIPSGYEYVYAVGSNPSNGQLVILQNSAGAVTGLTATSVLATTAGTPATNPIGIAGGAGSALVSTTAETGITGITTTITGGSAAGGASSQLPAGAYPAAITGAKVRFEAIFQIGQ